MDEVSVLVSDLEDIKATLDTVLKQNEAWDLFDNYRKMGQRLQWSALTRYLRSEIEKVEAYIEAAEEESNDES